MDEYIDVKLDVFEHVGQHARLRKALTVRGLIEEILREFDDIAADSPEKYAVFLKGADRPLTAASTMTELDIQPQDELVFEYVRQNIRRMLNPQDYAFLRDDVNGKVYELQWQPALIGRPTNEAEHNIMLAVNLQLHPKGQTVSRRHAEFTFSDGRYYIEALAENNPLAVNDNLVDFGTRREIKNRDRLTLGRNGLVLVFQTQASQVSQKSVSRPITGRTPEPQATMVDAIPFPVNEVLQQSPARLVIERSSTPGQAGQSLELASFPAQVGRSLPLLQNEHEVSRQHIEINYDPSSRMYTLTDLNSRNGVTLDGALITPAQPYELVRGMKIGLGINLLLRFEG